MKGPEGPEDQGMPGNYTKLRGKAEAKSHEEMKGPEEPEDMQVPADRAKLSPTAGLT